MSARQPAHADSYRALLAPGRPRFDAGAADPGEEPFALDSAPGRLPKDVVPLDYTVDIVPNITALILTGSESCAIASPPQLTARPQHPSRAPRKSLCSRR